MASLRDKEAGCPWDIEQLMNPSPIMQLKRLMSSRLHSFRNSNNIKEELGDLLLQVIFHAQIAKEDHLS